MSSELALAGCLYLPPPLPRRSAAPLQPRAPRLRADSAPCQEGSRRVCVRQKYGLIDAVIVTIVPVRGRAASCLKHYKSQLLVLTERLSLEGQRGHNCFLRFLVVLGVLSQICGSHPSSWVCPLLWHGVSVLSC